MAHSVEQLLTDLKTRFGTVLRQAYTAYGELNLEVAAEDLSEVCRCLRDEFKFAQLMDLCGVDYLAYGRGDWEVESSSSGFSRGVAAGAQAAQTESAGRFAVVYQLLSVSRNQRLRLKTFAEGEPPCLASVIDVWSAANWYEREAFDLYGILFDGHPDLRRILTDYGFVGHPFRKDFPLSGQVEMRYDPEQGRVVYQAVSIEPRVLVPRVLREDNRYLGETSG